jgi:hypothetical protein
MSIVQRLTENVAQRDFVRQGEALIKKWSETRLLEGITSDVTKRNMAVLLENQALQVLKEVSSMSGGNVEGFASVAFPIVRRVFGGLIANDLVSVQSMSLPAGLIFFLDFTRTGTHGAGNIAGDSIYGQGIVGKQVTGGVNITTLGNAEKAFYNLSNGYSSPTSSVSFAATPLSHLPSADGMCIVLSGTWPGLTGSQPVMAGGVSLQPYVDLGARLCRFDPDIPSGSAVVVFRVTSSLLKNAQFNDQNLVTIEAYDDFSAYKRLRDEYNFHLIGFCDNALTPEKKQ